VAQLHFGPLSAEVLARKKITVDRRWRCATPLPEAKQVAELWENGKEMTPQGIIDQGVQVRAERRSSSPTRTSPSRPAHLQRRRGVDGARVVVIGAAVVDTLFPGRPIGQACGSGASTSR